MPEISVIVPVYKVEPYLRRCVDSILDQTFTDFELILVDDGSPDNCPAICDEYAEQDDRVRVIHQGNGGLSAARNAGIDWAFANSNSRWISFIDSDDWVHETYLKVLYELTQTYKAQVAVCGIATCENKIKSVPADGFEGEMIYTRSEACAMVYRSLKGHATFVSSCSKLFAKKLLTDVRYPIGKIHEDQYITYLLLYQANRTVETGKRLYYYYINPDGITHSIFYSKRFDNIEACDQAIHFFEEQDEPTVVSAARHRREDLVVRYSVMARKAGVYKQIPKQYKMSISSAYKKLKLMYGIDECEYFLYQYYPQYVSMHAYARKICSILKSPFKALKMQIKRR